MSLTQTYSNYYQNDSVFDIDGYEVYFTRFSDSIIQGHFSEVIDDLKYVLSDFHINEEQIITGGGGLSSITKILRDRLYEKNWRKENIKSEQKVRNRIITSESHEVDHFKEFSKGNVVIEIEWNNKDPFFDRDLENFRKIHQIGDIAFGVIITRGKTLQSELLHVFENYLDNLSSLDIESIREEISLSVKDDKIISDYINECDRSTAIRKIAKKLYSSKYGKTTTHLDKLLMRVDRGVGNPCPLIIIGIGDKRLNK